MLVAQCLGCPRASAPSLLPLREFLHPTFTPTPPPLFSYPGVPHKGATDLWSGERCSHTIDTHTPTQLGSSDLRINKSYCILCGCRWQIERRLAGTKQVSTVGHLPPDPPPLSFLDSSSALSPWTNYEYRLVLLNQAGNTTGQTTIIGLTKIKKQCLSAVKSLFQAEIVDII